MTFSKVQDVKIPDKNPLRTLRKTLAIPPGSGSPIFCPDRVKMDLSLEDQFQASSETDLRKKNLMKTDDPLLIRFYYT